MGAVFKLKNPEQWEWQDLRDYVVTECVDHGLQYQGDGFKEKAMFSAFLKRWPEGRGQQIALYAFQVAQGLWKGQLVNPTMFSKGFDPYFAVEIDQLI